MKYYRIAESTFVRAKSITDGLRILNRYNAYGYTMSDLTEVPVDSVRNVHNGRYFKLYFDASDGFPRRAIMDCSRDADIIY